MKQIIMILAIISLSSCRSNQLEPAGIGISPNDLKRSPCACIEVNQEYSKWNTPLG